MHLWPLGGQVARPGGRRGSGIPVCLVKVELFTEH